LGRTYDGDVSVKGRIGVAAVFALWLPCLQGAQAQTADGSFEARPALTAAELVPAGLLQSPSHTLAEPVRIEGYHAVFDLQSAHGSFRATGRELLALRVAEFPAIEALGRINKGDAFTEALAKAAKAPLDFVGKLISDPGATLGGVATGIGQLVEKAGNVVRSGVDSVADGVSDIVTAKATDVEAGDEHEPPSFISDPFGYNKARRLWARTLNVDPYTSNPVLRQLLDDAASATFAGSFAVDTTLGVVAAPVKFVVGFDTDSRDAVWDLSPGDIESRLEARLAGMGIEGRPVRDFFRNRWFTPTLQTGLVGALEKLTDVKGRAAVVDLAARAQGEARVRSLIESVNLLADHHRQVSPLDELRSSAPLFVATRKDGELVAAIGGDYLFWNAAMAELVARTELLAPRRTLLIPGRASARARQEIERAGWVLMESGLPSPRPVNPAVKTEAEG
jgi:PAS domain-containing protein